MSPADAEDLVKALREDDNPLHIATTMWRDSAIKKLKRDPDSSPVCVELYLRREITDIDLFYGIFAVDSIGIWFYDGDGHIDEIVWRQRLIQWRDIDQIVIHQVS